MKILVTGATGFLGGNLTKFLGLKGHTVSTLIREPYILFPSDTQYIWRSNPEEIVNQLSGKGFEVVIHCAASYSYFDTPGNFPEMVDASILLPLTLNSWAASENVRVISIGSLF